MKSTRALARLGMLAVGLGIGGAVAATPGIASADSSVDWLSAVDSFLTAGALPAADTTPELNLAISFDGMSLFQDGSAHAYSGANGDIAIANGAGAIAYAFGTDNYASVDGADSTAIAGATSTAGAAVRPTTRPSYLATTATATPERPTRQTPAASTTPSSSATTTPHIPVEMPPGRAATTGPTSKAMISERLTRKVVTTWQTS